MITACKRFAFLAAVFLFAASHPAPALSGAGELPERLLHGPGIAVENGLAYATAVVPATGPRKDKALEIAKTKARFEALRRVAFVLGCGSLFDAVDPARREKLVLAFSPMATDINLTGARVARQWDMGDEFAVMVAAPVDQPGLACAYGDLRGLCAACVNGPLSDPMALELCLKELPRYSGVHARALERYALALERSGDAARARCLAPYPLGQDAGGPPLPVIQSRLLRADAMAAEAVAATSGDQAQARELALQALALNPGSCRAYLALALSMERTGDGLAARQAARKAMVDGLWRAEALDLLARDLEQSGDPRAEAYRHVQRTKQDTWDVVSGDGTGISTTSSCLAPVINSLGALPLADAKPSPAHAEAARVFGRAAGDRDVARALGLLLHALARGYGSAEEYNLAGACLRTLGKPGLALPFLWQALAIRPDYAYPLANLALCCQALGLSKAARFYAASEPVRDSEDPWVAEVRAGITENGS